MLFQEFVTTLEISVKMIFLETGKFGNIQNLSSTFENLRKALELQFLRKEFIENLI